MNDTAHRALAIVGLGAILPDAPDVGTFWSNVRDGRYSISDVSASRWDPALYYDADPAVPDKTYSKLGGWVRESGWDPMAWRLPIPPRVSDSMDEAQKWAVACARATLLDFGWPDRELDLDRTAVVIGNAMSGEQHYLTALRIHLPRFARALSEVPSFEALPEDVRRAISGEVNERFGSALPQINEDTMPGELSNCMAGRIANLFDLHGPNFVCDAACAAALAAIDAASEGLIEREYDAVLVGGVDRNMGPEPFVKFSKIGALSATGTRPYADGADGFVMGEGAAFFLLKRLADAESQGDRIYAVLRGVGGASDGKGKGITAPNPKGQQLAIERAWRTAGVPPQSVGLIEGHGTSTRVGDVVEVQSLNAVFGGFGLHAGSIPLGSVKSNIGHLKGAAGAAGLLKTVLALHEKVLPPSLGFGAPNPNIEFDATPFYVNTEAKPWDTPPDGVRRAGVSAFGFGGTNFHAVVEEYIPGRLTDERALVSVPFGSPTPTDDAVQLKSPLRGALVLGAPTATALRARVESVLAEARQGVAPPPAPPSDADLRAPERIAIDYGDASELATRSERALKALAADDSKVWSAVRSQGIFRGSGPAPKLAFLYTGQGSQYPNMLRELREREPVVRGRPGDGGTPRAAAQRVHLRRSRGRRGAREGEPGPAADRDHAAGGPHGGHGLDTAPGRLRDRSRRGDGSQPGRVRCARRLGGLALRRCAPGGERARARDGGSRGRGRGPHGRGLRAVGAGAGGGRVHGGERRGGQREQPEPGRHRRSERAGDARHSRVRGARRQRRAAQREPRLPHDDRGAGERAVAPDPRRPAPGRPRDPAGGQRRRRAVSERARRRGAHGGSAGGASGLAGAVRQGARDTLCARRTRGRGGRAEEGAARLRVGRAGRSHRLHGALLEPPEGG
jgi:3-oxoacyl-(acyl-carrier-protein) synthase